MRTAFFLNMALQFIAVSHQFCPTSDQRICTPCIQLKGKVQSWCGIGRGVREVSEEDKADAASFPFDEGAEMKSLGASGPHGEEGFSTLERRCNVTANILLPGG